VLENLIAHLISDIVLFVCVINVWNNLPSMASTVNFASLMTFRQTIVDVNLSNYIKSSSGFYFILYFFHIFMGGCQCPVDLAVQLAQVCSAMLIVLFEQNKMYMCMYVCVIVIACMLCCVMRFMRSNVVFEMSLYCIMLQVRRPICA